MDLSSAAPSVASPCTGVEVVESICGCLQYARDRKACREAVNACISNRYLAARALSLNNLELTEIPASLIEIKELGALLLDAHAMAAIPQEDAAAYQQGMLALQAHLAAKRDMRRKYYVGLNEEQRFSISAKLTAICRDEERDAVRCRVHAIFLGWSGTLTLDGSLMRGASAAAPPQTIPALVWLQGTLHTLILSDSDLSHLPEEVCSLAVLGKLTLRSNTLVDLPSSFSKLQALQMLDLSLNAFQQFPNVLLSLGSLTKLYLDGNRVTDLPAAITQMRTLTVLQLFSNPLERPPLEVAERGVTAIFDYFEHEGLKSGDVKKKLRFLSRFVSAVGSPAAAPAAAHAAMSTHMKLPTPPSKQPPPTPPPTPPPQLADDETEVYAIQREAARRRGQAKPKRRSKGRVRIDLIRAEGLRAADNNGLSDPYVTMTLGWDEDHACERTEKSKVFHKTLNPVFDWTYFFSYESFDALQGEVLVLKAFDHDKLSFNDALGHSTVPLSPFMPQLAKGETISVTLDLADGQERPGKVYVKLSYEPAVSGSVHLDLIKAEALKAADKNGLSDPYVTVSIGDRTEKSKVFHKTLNPQFDW